MSDQMKSVFLSKSTQSWKCNLSTKKKHWYYLRRHWFTLAWSRRRPFGHRDYWRKICVLKFFCENSYQLAFLNFVSCNPWNPSKLASLNFVSCNPFFKNLSALLRKTEKYKTQFSKCRIKLRKEVRRSQLPFSLFNAHCSFFTAHC